MVRCGCVGLYKGDTGIVWTSMDDMFVVELAVAVDVEAVNSELGLEWTWEF